MKQGFALIDLLVSIAISGIMSIAIFTILFQIQKSEEVIVKTINTSMQAALISERMQKDFNGLFSPVLMPPKPEAPKNNDQVIEEPAPNEPKIAKIWYSENTQINGLEVLKEVSFITCNPLQVYNSNRPRVVRIIYRLASDLQAPDSLTLSRQESLDLDYNQSVLQAATQSFVLAEGLRAVNLAYFYQEEIDQDQAEITEQFPRYIILKLSIWEDASHQNYQDYEFWFYVPSAQKDQDKQDTQEQDESK